MTGKKDVGLLVVLTAAMGIGPLVNYGLSTTSALIIEDFGISTAQFGLLATACFVSAAVGSTLLGRLSDEIPAKAQVGIIFGGTAAGLLAIALAPGYAWLLGAMAIAGLAQALSNPMTNRIIMLRVIPERRAGWIGVKQSGVQGSQLIAGLFFPAVALMAGWRWAAAAAAAISIVLMLWSWNRIDDKSATGRSVPDPMRSRPAVLASKRRIKAAVPVRTERTAKLPNSVWLLAGYSLCCGAGLQATNIYMPLFAQREFGVGLLVAGLTAGLAGLVGVASRIFWGRRMNDGNRASQLLALLAVGALLGAASFTASAIFDAQPLLWLGVVLHGATALGGNVVVMSALLHAVPTSRVGTASGIVAVGLYSGFALGPLVMGYLLEHSTGFLSGWIFVAVSYMPCILLSLALRGGRRRDMDEAFLTGSRPR